jgi:hypothetical protein
MDFMPRHRLCGANFRPHADTLPIDEQKVLVLQEDCEALGKAGIYQDDYGLNCIDLPDEYHDDINISWHALQECKETCLHFSSRPEHV